MRLIIIASFAPVSVASQGRSPTPAFWRGIDRGGPAERSTNVAPAAERVGSPSILYIAQRASLNIHTGFSLSSSSIRDMVSQLWF